MSFLLDLRHIPLALLSRLAAGAVRAREMDKKRQRAVAKGVTAAAQTKGPFRAGRNMEGDRGVTEADHRVEVPRKRPQVYNARVCSRLLFFFLVKQSY